MASQLIITRGPLAFAVRLAQVGKSVYRCFTPGPLVKKETRS